MLDEKYILIVDDDKEFAESLAAAYFKGAYEVCVAKS